MRLEAVRVQAALSDVIDQTETEIALASGMTLAEVRRGLDELSLLGAVDQEDEGGLSVWMLRGALND